MLEQIHEARDVRKVVYAQVGYDSGNASVFTHQILSVIIILSLHLYFLFALPIINME